MSTNRKSFWSTIPGLITGLAGILTALVGLATLLIQIGVIGDEDGDSPTTTRPGATTSPRAGGGDSGDSGATRPRFTVAPDELKLTAGEKTGNVTVSNTGEAAFTLSAEITGSGKDQFTLSRGTCGAEVPEGGSCRMTVSFKGALAATAELVVTARGAAGPQEVALDGSLL